MRGTFLKLLRGRYSFLIILALALSSLVFSFQNCAPSHQSLSTPESQDGINHKIDVESEAGALSVFDVNSPSEPGQNLLKTLPTNRPLALLVRNGQLYPGVQVIVNSHSFLVSDYLKFLKLYTPESPSVPIFYSPNSEGNILEDSTLEALNQIRVDFGTEDNSSVYCDAIVNLHQDPLAADLIVQIADATSMLTGNSALPLSVYWSLPLRIFSPAVCSSP